MPEPPSVEFPVVVACRVDQGTADQLDSLLELYPRAEGRDARRSDVLRALLKVALPSVGDVTLHRRLRDLAGHRDVGEVCREALLVGLRELEVTT